MIGGDYGNGSVESLDATINLSEAKGRAGLTSSMIGSFS
jgi:hypothetical protein